MWCNNDMPETVGETFRRIVRIVKESRKDGSPFDDLNHPHSVINNPHSEVNHPHSKYNHPHSACNHPQGSKEARMAALKELVDKYLFDHLSEELRNELVDKYV